MDIKLRVDECTINGIKYENPPDIIGNKDKYEFLQWDFELGDCVIFDIRTLHGVLSSSIPNKNIKSLHIKGS